MSRRHARLVRSPSGGWTIRDLGSSNGTVVDGVEIAAQEDRPIGDGTRLEVGDIVLTFRVSLPWPDGVRPLWQESTAGAERPYFDQRETELGRREPVQEETRPMAATKHPWYRRVFRRLSG